jgi:predicted nucleic acid-binding Zn ribbon protein
VGSLEAYNEKTFMLSARRRAGGRVNVAMSSSPKGRGPKPLSEILGHLFASRGYGRLQAMGELEFAWNAAVGEPGYRQTRVGGVRRGVLNVTVANPSLLEELSTFQKPTLLAALRREAPGTPIHDIRFRVGPIDPPAQASTANPTPAPTATPAPKGSKGRRGRDGR